MAYGESEVRLHQEPFSLFPGEEIVGKLTKMKMIAADEAFKLRCIQSFIEPETKIQRNPGEPWLRKGKK